MADEKNIQSEGRNDNAAQPLNAAKDNAGADRYPSVDQHDAIERTGRDQAVTGENPSFQPGGETKTRNETAPPEDASTDGDDVPSSANDGRLGPGGDPVEGKR
jgi:hypothetical protein